MNLPRKTIFIINGSASQNSSNHRLIDYFVRNIPEAFDVHVWDDLKKLPHFDPELSAENPPEIVLQFRKAIEQADAVLICTPEYVFSIPSGLKNALEWCVVTTVFTDKPVGLITASANGRKGHEELQLIMRTLSAIFSQEATLLIQGIKGKIAAGGNFTNENDQRNFELFAAAFFAQVK